jgi:hypothetical protein
MKKTAVQWLIEEVKKFNTVITKEYMLMLFQQSIEIERQQIIDAWIDGEGYDCIAASPQAEHYYTQTFTEPKND